MISILPFVLGGEKQQIWLKEEYRNYFHLFLIVLFNETI